VRAGTVRTYWLNSRFIMMGPTLRREKRGRPFEVPVKHKKPFSATGGQARRFFKAVSNRLFRAEHPGERMERRGIAGRQSPEGQELTRAAAL
jgi:hypothetical protein